MFWEGWREGCFSNFVKPQISLKDNLGAKLPLVLSECAEKTRAVRGNQRCLSLAVFRSAHTAHRASGWYQQASSGLQLNRTLDRSFLFLSSPFLNRLVVYLGSLIHVCKGLWGWCSALIFLSPCHKEMSLKASFQCYSLLQLTWFLLKTCNFQSKYVLVLCLHHISVSSEQLKNYKKKSFS